MNTIRYASNLVELFHRRAGERGDQPFLWSRAQGRWVSRSWREVADEVAALAAGARDLDSFGFLLTMSREAPTLHGVRSHRWDAVLEDGGLHPFDVGASLNALERERPACIIHTSGRSGSPRARSSRTVRS